MGYVVRMPQLGMTMEEGIVVEWAVDVGEPFDEGDVVVVVESEKTTNDIEARRNGVVLEQFVALEEPVEPGDPIAYVGEEGESVPDVREEAGNAGAEEVGETDHESESTAEAITGAGESVTLSPVERKVSPRARSYAAEHDVRLDGIEGSGSDGVVIEADVIAAAERDATPAATDGVIKGRGIYEERSGNQLRQTVARRMTQSAREAPQVTLNRRVPVDNLLDAKDRLAADLALDVSLSNFVVAALVDAIDEYPEFNGIYEDGTHKLARNVNVGVAVDIEGGLVTPVIKGAQQLSLAELNAERTRLVKRVQRDEHTSDDFAHSTITVSNLGHFDVDSFDPILNPPEVTILGVCSLRAETDPETGEPVRTLGLSLTFDHRAVDGADAARFLDAIADALAHPLRLVGFDRDGASEADEMTSFHEGEEIDEERTAHASHEEGMRAAVRSRRFGWVADEPTDLGGDDSAPNPVEQFLGSLAACLTVTIRTVADRRDIVLDDVEVDVHAEPPEGRIESIETRVMLFSEENRQQLQRVVQTAERVCYVSNVVSTDIERSLDLTVESP